MRYTSWHHEMYYFIIIILIYQVYDTVFRYKNRILDINKSILVIKKSNSYYSESDVLIAIKNGQPFNPLTTKYAFWRIFEKYSCSFM